MPARPIIVVEDDPFTRLIPLVLDPDASEERRTAFADFMLSPEVHAAIKTLGVDKYGQALFVPVAGTKEDEVGGKE